MKGANTRSTRDRSRNQKDEKATPIDNKNNKKEIQIDEIEYKITLKSNFKTLLDQFVDNEIKKNSNFKKQKNENIYNFVFKNKTLSDEIIAKTNSNDMFKSSELRVFLNDKEIINTEKQIKKVEVEKQNTEEIELSNNNKINNIPESSTVTNIKDNQDIREILVLNIPEKLNNDKIYEIFFIFGDISSIEFVRDEKKAYVKYKYSSSSQKAFKKLNSDKYQSKNLKVEFSDINTRLNIQNDNQNMEEKSVGRVIFIKFSDAERVPEKEEIKKILKKYGLVTKIFRKKEGRSYYIEFSSESSSEDLLKDYFSKHFNIPHVVEVNYAFDKDTIKNKDLLLANDNKKINELEINNKNIPSGEINQTSSNNKQEISSSTTNNGNINSSANIQTLDPNKHWQVYFDATYQMNYYFNPFFNQSVWELPEGAEMTPYQETQLYYDPQTDIQNQVVPENIQSSGNKGGEGNYYDDDAWEEDELREKLVFDKIKEHQLKEWMKRAARQQLIDNKKDTAYVEGNYDYNIWYDKYLTDRKEEKEKIPALNKCNPALDTGYTKADLQEKEGGAIFCRFFAKGCCSEGVNCRYYHRVPTKEDAEKIENLRDVFGRSRFAVHRNDMGGVGTFSRECRTLFVNDIKMLDTANPVKEMVRIIYENFSPWGDIEDINYIPAKATCFIRFGHRCFAEFAKEAMMGQSLIGEEVLTVKWAYDDPNPMNKKRVEKENENRFLSAHNKKQETLTNLKEEARALPNSDYHCFYENQNNPYAYSSGYGNDEALGNTTEVVDEVTSNYAKLSETLRMIDQMNEEDGNN